jgi:inorganic triphosphatase YgiF
LPAKRTSSSSAFESEIPLIIKEDARHVRKDLENIHHLLDYDLEPKPSRIIHDTYYDTTENSLRQRKITLRTRRVGRTLLISSKSDIRRISGNIVRRRERELPWAYDSVRLVAKNLKLNTPTMSSPRFQRVPASRTLEAMGLRVIQERRTQRVARDIVRRGTSPTLTLAELAIDSVTYTFDRISVGFSEIEIEAKAAGGLSTVREVANELLSKYQHFLRPWSHGKFATGLAIRKLLKTKKLQQYLANGELNPSAFQLIDRTIRSGI